jgi:hypothetical protein
MLAVIRVLFSICGLMAVASVTFRRSSPRTGSTSGIGRAAALAFARYRRDREAFIRGHNYEAEYNRL